MMIPPTPEQYSRLPKYAREYLNSLERQNEELRRKLRDYEDAQTPSKMWYEEFVSDGDGNRTVRKYVQSERLCVVHDGVHLTVNCYRDGQIELQWGIPSKHGTAMLGDVGLIPMSYSAAKLVNMAYNPVELARLKDMKHFTEQQEKSNDDD